MSSLLTTNGKTAARDSGAPDKSGVLRRKCACGKNTAGGGDCGSCSKKDKGLLSRSPSGPAPAEGVPQSVHNTLRSHGRPLDETTRTFFESRFSHDFAGVRVHTDAEAAQSARAVGALAFTVGQNIVFGAGQFQTGTDAGRRLLAHELAHTIQQGTTTALPAARLETTTPGDADERQAEVAADAAMRGRPFARVPHGPLRLARQTPLQSASTYLATPAPAAEQQGGDGPRVSVVPDKATGTARVFVNDVQLYEVRFPNAQGGMKTESSWDPAARTFTLKLTVTQGVQVVQSPDGVAELSKASVNYNLGVAQLSLPGGPPVLTKEGGGNKALKSSPQDPDLKRSYLSAEREEYPQTLQPVPVEKSLTPAQGEEGIWESVGEWVHGVLDVIGWIPIFGEIADAINAIIYLVEGRYAEALVSGLAIIPIVGDMGKVGKWTVKGVKELSEEAGQQGVKLITQGVTTGGKRAAGEAAESGGKQLTKEVESAGSDWAETAAKIGTMDEAVEWIRERNKPKEDDECLREFNACMLTALSSTAKGMGKTYGHSRCSWCLEACRKMGGWQDSIPDTPSARCDYWRFPRVR